MQDVANDGFLLFSAWRARAQCGTSPMVVDDRTLPRMVMIQAASRPASCRPRFNNQALSLLLSVLNHEIRLEILELLAQGAQDVSTIADALDLHVRTVSHHLSPLRRAGLVCSSRDKTRHIYALTQRVICSIDADQVSVDIQSAHGLSATFTLQRSSVVNARL